MISMAPSSFTMGASDPAATRATAATMGPKRSSMAWTSSMGDGGTGEAAGFDGGAGFRFTLQLSHASIAAHGLHALAGEHISRAVALGLLTRKKPTDPRSRVVCRTRRSPPRPGTDARNPRRRGESRTAPWSAD